MPLGSVLFEGSEVPERFGPSHCAYTAQCWASCAAAPGEEGQGVRRWQGDSCSEPRIHIAWESPMPLPKAPRDTWPKETRPASFPSSLSSLVESSFYLSEFARAAMVKFYSLGGLSSRNLLLRVLGTGSSRKKCQPPQVLVKACSVYRCLLACPPMRVCGEALILCAGALILSEALPLGPHLNPGSFPRPRILIPPH